MYHGTECLRLPQCHQCLSVGRHGAKIPCQANPRLERFLELIRYRDNTTNHNKPGQKSTSCKLASSPCSLTSDSRSIISKPSQARNESKSHLRNQSISRSATNVERMVGADRLTFVPKRSELTGTAGNMASTTEHPKSSRQRMLRIVHQERSCARHIISTIRQVFGQHLKISTIIIYLG